MSLSMLTLGVLVTLRDQFSGPAQQMQGTASKLGGSLVKFGAGLSGFGLLARPVSSAATGALRDLASVAGSVDQAAAMLRSMPDMTDAATQRMTAAARAWAREHSNSVEEFLGASYQMLSAGLNEQAAIAATQTGLTVATATMGDHVAVANLLAVAYNNMGDKTRPVGEEITRLGDILTRAQQTFQISDMTQLGEGLKYVMDNAITAKLPMTQLATVIGKLNSGGLQGSMAGTAMEASMIQMTRAAEEYGFTIQRGADGQMDYIATLRALAETMGDVSHLSDADNDRLIKSFGQQGAAAISLLLPKLDELEAGLIKVSGSTGAAKDAAAQMEQGAVRQWQILTNNLRDLQLEIGTALLPTLKALMEPLRAMIQGVGDFAATHPNLTRWGLAAVAMGAALAPILSVAGALLTLAGLALKLGPVLAMVYRGMQFLGFAATVGGQLLTMKLVAGLKSAGAAMLKFGAAMLASPITWVVAGVAALAAGAYLIYKNWEPISDLFGNLWGSIKAGAASAVVTVLESVQGMVAALPKWARPDGLGEGLDASLAEWRKAANFDVVKQAEFRMVGLSEAMDDMGLSGLMNGAKGAAAGTAIAASVAAAPALAAGAPAPTAPVITQHNQITIHATGTPDQVQTAVTNGLAALADRTGTYDGG
ncbi:MAG: phage tail tape measure protein [Zoogloeaceae bacterium]|nr:phage tail tape measure protein [Zoogloeaceae bacterium]